MIEMQALYANDTKKLFLGASEYGDVAVATEALFTKIFEELDENYPYIYRIRVMLPDILGESVYEDFNLGRLNAICEHYNCYPSKIPMDDVPVSTCVGTDTSTISIMALLGPTKPVVIDNNIQVKPFEYPEEYGEVPPIFSRAAQIGNHLYISGTASIVKSETIGLTFEGQLGTTLTNITILIAHSNKLTGKQLTFTELSFICYLPKKYYTDENIKLVKKMFGTPKAKFYMADLCRPDLFVEIEATEIGAE